MDWLPDAVRDDHGHRLAWAGAAPARGVLHTTEGSGWPTYSGWTISPHATVMPVPGVGVTVHQHVPFSSAAFALRNAAGGAETNRLHAFQFELIGTCDPAAHGMYHWPSADDAVLTDLWRKVIAPLDAAERIPLRSTVRWLAFPASFGATTARLTGTQWQAYSGWLGHQHVPENDHGDPGAFPWPRLLQLARGTDMPLTADDVKTLLQADCNQGAGGATKTTTVGVALLRAVEADQRTGALADDIATIEAKIAAISTGGVDPAALAEALAPALGPILDPLVRKAVADVLHTATAG